VPQPLGAHSAYRAFFCRAAFTRMISDSDRRSATPRCGLSGRRTGLPAVRQSSSRLRGSPGTCGDEWLPGVEEGDDSEDALVGVQGGGDSELAEDVVDVLFYRTLSYPEGLGNPAVGLTRGHQRQHLSFS